MTRARDKYMDLLRKGVIKRPGRATLQKHGLEAEVAALGLEMQERNERPDGFAWKRTMYCNSLRRGFVTKPHRVTLKLYDAEALAESLGLEIIEPKPRQSRETYIERLRAGALIRRPPQYVIDRYDLEPVLAELGMQHPSQRRKPSDGTLEQYVRLGCQGNLASGQTE